MADEKYPDVFFKLRRAFDDFYEESSTAFMQDVHTDEIVEKEADENAEFSDMVNELKETSSIAEGNKYEDLTALLDLLSTASEKFQKIRLSINNENVGIDKSLVELLKKLFDIKIHGKNTKLQVKWFGHLLHQLKLIRYPKTQAYCDLLKMFDIFWDSLVKPSYNDDRRYLQKLIGFVSHLDEVKYSQMKNVNKAFEKAENAKKFYQESESWKDETIKVFLTEKLEKSIKELSNVRREQEYKDGVIGKQGGRLITNCCEIVIPKNAVDEERQMTIDTNVNKINLPDDYLPISPTLVCYPKIELYENASVKIPTFCTTDNLDVEASVFAESYNSLEYECIYKAPLNEVEKDFPFITKKITKFVIGLKKTLFHRTTYRLHSDVWYSPQGNFTGVVCINDKSVKELWQEDLKLKGYKPSQVNTNSLTVKGSDSLQFELACKNSGIIKFDKAVSDFFTVKENLSKNEQKHFVNFRLPILPVGDETIVLRCGIKSKDRTLSEEEWNEIWVEATDKNIEDVFNKEIIPSFDDINVWRHFATSTTGLALTDREINRNINYEKPIKEQMFKALRLWQEKSSGTGKRPSDENENTLKNAIRKMTIEFREYSY